MSFKRGSKWLEEVHGDRAVKVLASDPVTWCHKTFLDRPKLWAQSALVKAAPGKRGSKVDLREELAKSAGGFISYDKICVIVAQSTTRD